MSSLFQPDVESLIRPIRVTKPNETYIFPGAPNDPNGALPLPEPVVADSSLFAAQGPPRQQLQDEAARAQELLDMLTDTAVSLTAAVPEEDQALLGVASVSTQDYLASLGDNSPNAQRLRHAFEWGVLLNPQVGLAWPLLTAPDLAQIRDDLLHAAVVLTGAPLAQTPLAPSTPAAWEAAASGSPLASVHQTLITNAQQYRLKVAQAVFTEQAGLGSDLLTGITAPLGTASAPEAPALLAEIIRALTSLRALLTSQQFLQAGEFVTDRDALISSLETAALNQLLQSFTVMLSRVQAQVIQPVLTLFESGIRGSGGLLGKIEDGASRQVAGVVGSAMLSLNRYATGILADMLRTVNRQHQGRLNKAQNLGERNLITRWVSQLDQGILILERAASPGPGGRTSLQTVAAQVAQPLAASTAPLLQRLLAHPELSAAQSVPLVPRGTGL